MTRFTRVLLIATVLAMAPHVLSAQGREPDADSIRVATSAIRGDLRNFLTAQEAYFADNGAYAQSIRTLATFYNTSPTVTVVLLTSSATSHSEIAIDRRVPGLVCGMFIGDVAPPLGRGSEAEIVCRGP